jgi:hypothetical protein
VYEIIESFNFSINDNTQFPTKTTIRQSKFTSDFKYFTEEILLVVIGILIVVSLNNWKETRKQNLPLNNMHQLVKQELSSAAANMPRSELFKPRLWGPILGLVTGVILIFSGGIHLTVLGNALLRGNPKP